MAGDLVETVLNGPRYSTGAFGLGSKVSMWLSPPLSQKRTTDFAFTGNGPGFPGDKTGMTPCARVPGNPADRPQGKTDPDIARNTRRLTANRLKPCDWIIGLTCGDSGWEESWISPVGGLDFSSIGILLMGHTFFGDQHDQNRLCLFAPWLNDCAKSPGVPWESVT
jgi:hypothetical protein